MMNQIRCGWVSADPEYIAYHDNEWGKTVKQRNTLFEMLCLEGQQAGLSWLQILKRRQAYRQHFYDFVPEQVATLNSAELQQRLQSPQLIRNQAKLASIINNARALLQMESKQIEFVQFIWQFVDYQPKISHYHDYKHIPAWTDLSTRMSRSLKQHGFKFVGPTICQSFMQACGLFIDHEIQCFCHPAVGNCKS